MRSSLVFGLFLAALTTAAPIASRDATSISGPGSPINTRNEEAFLQSRGGTVKHGGGAPRPMPKPTPIAANDGSYIQAARKAKIAKRGKTAKHGGGAQKPKPIPMPPPTAANDSTYHPIALAA